MMRSKRGLTLIELLVVIAIIAILAAICYPVWANKHYGKIADKVMPEARRQEILTSLQAGSGAEVKVGKLTFIAIVSSPHETGVGNRYLLWVKSDYKEMVASVYTAQVEIDPVDLDILISRLLKHYEGDVELLKGKLADKPEAPAQSGDPPGSPPKA